MLNWLRSIGKVFIRTFAFLRKEIYVIVRQPRLLLTLVMGPFLIMLIFGLGYRDNPSPMRTLYVAEPGSQIEAEIMAYAPALSEHLAYMGISGNEESALEKLRRGEVDLVAVAPDDPLTTIQSGQQAEFKLYHAEIDPLRAGYVGYLGRIYTDEVNRWVLRSVTTQGQSQAVDLREGLQAARENTQAIKTAVNAGDEASAQAHLSELSNNVDVLAMAVGSSLVVMNSVDSAPEDGNGDRPGTEIMSLLENLQSVTAEMQDGRLTSENSEWETQVDEIDANISELETQLDTFTSLNPEIIVQPFTSQAESIARVEPDTAIFYAPAVIALLLQHLAVTIAALSIVHERNYGTMELFRVAPLSAAELLTGKYISYMLFGAVIAAVLSGLMHFGLGVPMLGNWLNYVLVIGVLLFTSLGIGFIISLFSSTDSQAVQYTMFVLWISVFFSGFLMNLNLLVEPVRSLSWGIPTTYGIILLRTIALRGGDLDWLLIGGLALIGLALCVITWFILDRIIANRQ